eukprot:5183982-Pyramimonas_sp.AAC.1
MELTEKVIHTRVEHHYTCDVMPPGGIQGILGCAEWYTSRSTATTDIMPAGIRRWATLRHQEKTSPSL